MKLVLDNCEDVKKNVKIMIYGAKSLALGMEKAVRYLYPECLIEGFIVTSMEGNASVLDDLPVYDVESFVHKIGKDIDYYHILICTPQDLHEDIVNTLKKYGFHNYTCMDSRREACLMEKYYERLGVFKSAHGICGEKEKTSACVYITKFFKDRELRNDYIMPEWCVPIQVGAALTDERITDVVDCVGDNISERNVNYCELTALYWMWKNGMSNDMEYYGLFHYRRLLDISEEDLCRMGYNDVDVVLQFPTIHEPDISEHHKRYLKDCDWDAMIQALNELQPEYAKAFQNILKQPYFYNYNMLVAKKTVLINYCEWLFPILGRTEELSNPKGWERSDRYIGYLAESLMTLYFMYHKDDLNICHTGRIMLT